jgi:hypothetical protein
MIARIVISREKALTPKTNWQAKVFLRSGFFILPIGRDSRPIDVQQNDIGLVGILGIDRRRGDGIGKG